MIKDKYIDKYKRILKLHLICPNEFTFPEWKLCEQLLGNFGIIKENKNIDDTYYFVTKYRILFLEPVSIK